MSRTADWSLAYFPLDSGFFEDKRIRRCRSKFGAAGPMLYLYILCSCYGGEGFYVNYTPEWVEDAAMDLGCTAEKIELMLHYLLNQSLLDSTLFDTVKVLSSHGIQAQYQRSKKSSKQDIEVDGRLWVLSESETAGFIKVRLIPETSQKKALNSEKKELISEKKATKESKVKEIKENESKVKDSSSAPGASDTAPTFQEICVFNASLGSVVDPVKFYNYYSQVGWTFRGTPMDWKSKLTEWTRSQPRKPRVQSAAEHNALKKAGITKYKEPDLEELKAILAEL